jgi:ubiquinone/menaquinone biosynthesis C-methylase UbiE
MLSSTALYTDLSGYYDLMCCDINYQAQSRSVKRLHQMFGNGGKTHLDLACGTGPHIRHFIDAGYDSMGLDIHQPMLDIAKARCPEAGFMLDNMCNFRLENPVDLITCFLYSIHYSSDISQLQQCIRSAHAALNSGGMFCFNAVDKDKICNQTSVRHSTLHNESRFEFESCWHYPGSGDKQALHLSINKSSADKSEQWRDQHAMVAVSFAALNILLEPWFDVQMLEHDYDKILPWNTLSGNALFVCIKR